MIAQRIGVVTNTRIPQGGPRVAPAQLTREELFTDNKIDSEPEKGSSIKGRLEGTSGRTATTIAISAGAFRSTDSDANYLSQR